MNPIFLETERSQPERAIAGGTPLIIAASSGMLEVLALARRAATGDAKVLITGESGVGKDLVARQIHLSSRRAAGPFIAINCAGLTETLLESELFGHVKGSFTDAHRDKPGKLQLAGGNVEVTAFGKVRVDSLGGRHFANLVDRFVGRSL